MMTESESQGEFSHTEGGSVPESVRRAGGEAHAVDPLRGTDTTMATAVYVLYLVGLAASIAALVGVGLAHANRRAAAGTWLETHYQYQIRTFWYGLGLVAVGFATLPILIGGFVLLFWWVWAAVRTVKGWNRLSRREPIADPESLWW